VENLRKALARLPAGNLVPPRSFVGDSRENETRMPRRDHRAARLALFAVLAGSLALGACNGESPPAKVGSGAGQTNNTGAPSGRTTTQGDAQQSGGGG
jgi:hypothetical protein